MGQLPIQTTRAPKARRHVGASIITALLAGALLWAGAGVASAVTVPADGAYFGAYVQSQGSQAPMDAVNSFERLVGRKIKVVNKYHPFTDHSYRFEADLIATGHIPMISWRATDDALDGHRAEKIASGQYDSLIRTTADALKQLGGRVLLRFAWEMDQPPGERQYIGSSSEVIAAWRRVYNIFQSRNANNVEFLWAPRGASFSKSVGQTFYPGDAYVDWIGGSAVPLDNWNSFGSIFDGFYSWGSQQSKPLFIWVGIRENPNSTAWKASWISDMSATIRQSMPAVKAFVYYHALSPKGYRFWVDTSASALRAYKDMGSKNFFNP
ncbi:MAG: hypothetical protein ABI572_02840 [Actinomycetota bacterium]